MRSNNLNAIRQLECAITMVKIETIAPPRSHNIDIGIFDVRCLVSAGRTDWAAGEFDFSVAIPGDEDDFARLLYSQDQGKECRRAGCVV
jgi:hypothetical protein